MARIRSSTTTLLTALAMTIATVAPSGAATITIVNNDGPGEGFNDPTPVVPVGGNPGTTLGAQRLFVFNHAASLWGSLLPSAVTIRVRAQFNSQACDATSAILGSAAATNVYSDFSGAEFSGTWYHKALANKLAGVDQDPSTEDISATFNSDVDNSTCLGASDWYYGIDGIEGADIELLPVVLHEIGHGLGFSTFANKTTGSWLLNQPDIYGRFLLGKTTGLLWPQMNNRQRKDSVVDTGNLAWSGPAVTLMAPYALEKQPEVLVLSPGTIAGSYSALAAAFGPPLGATGLTANVVLVDDGVAPASDACEPIVNGPQLSGNIALIDRGTCTFVLKVKSAQDNGAIGVIMVNNVAGAPIPMGGSDPTITIPSVMISQSDGALIKNELLSGAVNATLRRHPTLLAGAHPDGEVLVYAPNPVESGSSVSHFDTSALPDLLMEPAISDDLHDGVDLTLYLFHDIGWLPRASGVETTSGSPGGFRVLTAPNPFRPSTVISLVLSEGGQTRVDVFDPQGRLVKRLLDAWMPAGVHAVTWDGTNEQGRRVAAGVYFSRVIAGGRSTTRPMVKLGD